jgi:hypothetical protein
MQALTSPRSLPLGRWPKPERRRGRLHGLVRHGEEFGRDRVQVDLIAQAGAECLDGLSRVVPAAVEAPIHRLLDAAAGRLEQGRHGQGGGGHNPGGRILAQTSEQLAEGEHDAGVDDGQQDGEGP